MKTKYVRRGKDEFEREITLLGKVQRKLLPDQEVDVVGIFPQMAALKTANTEQRRAARKLAESGDTATKAFAEAIQEVVEYPALELLPIAVYQ